MKFRITHRTQYQYATPAFESFMEARLTPLNNEKQVLVRRDLSLEPSSDPMVYTDYFGNTVEFFSITHRHEKLVLKCRSEVETLPITAPPESLEVSVSEARQIYRSERIKLYEFMRTSPAVDLPMEASRIGRKLIASASRLGPGLHDLLYFLHRYFKYEPGSTGIGSTVAEILRQKKGVCQDFAHVMIAILRSAEIPARYVCGYIETDSEMSAAERGEMRLVGASESHAWVEVYLPGGYWYPLDPTNDCVAGERHVMLSTGRDFFDTSPTRGIFKGVTSQNLQVRVSMQRKSS